LYGLPLVGAASFRSVKKFVVIVVVVVVVGFTLSFRTIEERYLVIITGDSLLFMHIICIY